MCFVKERKMDDMVRTRPTEITLQGKAFKVADLEYWRPAGKEIHIQIKGEIIAFVYDSREEADKAYEDSGLAKLDE